MKFNYNMKDLLYKGTLNTDIGDILLGATAKGIVLLQFIDEGNEMELLERLQKTRGFSSLQDENKIIQQAKVELSEYFEGNRTTFEVALDSKGTPFQRRVWDTLQTIPYGTTISYQEQAKRLGNIKAVRAVGTANGRNPIAIIVPCHRVVGKNGTMTGYAGGVERKYKLISHEREVFEKH